MSDSVNEINKNNLKHHSDYPPESVLNALFVKSADLPVSKPVEVCGYDFNEGLNYSKLFSSFATTGFQATNFALGVNEINKMLDKKMEPIPIDEQCEINLDPCGRAPTSCTIFLGYTSNMISSGIRETIRFLTQHNLVDCIVTTAGGVEEDIIKCFSPTYVGDFHFKGSMLRDMGINRIGNLLAPNDNYCKFQDWIMPILDQMLIEQKTENFKWTPSKIISRLGKEINDKSSVCYWCYKNNIPVYSPALTDGSLGDMLYMHSYRNPGLAIDIIEDLCMLNTRAVRARSTGVIILGGGLIKHHICNANMMRNGADFCLYVNTAQEFDGSDAGASPDEAISWGKIKKIAQPVKIHAEASLVFPLLVAETFAKRIDKMRSTEV
ncbi:hypothetical protein HELRODRAFT_184989 [Helobdella robusta]|uniref:deoxyhypusine synthase n=1 Tax=Helobdella robusta TaxID=6412 RepID=T1FM85_HELRO|nr:hypothetical protein HELRODRAFT_184989 [Helobdella robusta]ESO02420.1 hypothetical protein HELRODRAFT_184989 [Helobdella robusta]